MTSSPEHGRDRHDPGARNQRLSDVVELDAPLPGSRAMALTAAIARTVATLDPTDSPARLDPSEVVLHDDGTVTVAPRAGAARCTDPADSELGASIGRMLFTLLVGRAPLSRDEGYEPALRAALPMTTCALVARSASDAPGQWPSPEEWVAELARVAAAHAPPPPPAERRRNRRRRQVLVAALIALVAASLAAAVLAPRWWDDATDDGREGALAAPAQHWSTPAQSGLAQSVRDSS